jgi:hypothetical protein
MGYDCQQLLDLERTHKLLQMVEHSSKPRLPLLQCAPGQLYKSEVMWRGNATTNGLHPNCPCCLAPQYAPSS